MKNSYFGEFGGCFVPELLMPPLMEVEAAMRDIYPTGAFQEELNDLLHNYAGRATPLTHCPTLSGELGFDLWLKREDLLHTGAHKVNNTLGQALLAKHMGKTALVAETGAGQHGVATATPCCPAPVSAMMRVLPIRRAIRICPMVLLILWAPVWLRSSRLR